MPIESQCWSLFNDKSNICSICYRLQNICSRNVLNLDRILYKWFRSNVDIPIASQYATSYVLAIVLITIHVTVYEIITFDVFKWSQLESLNFKN